MVLCKKQSSRTCFLFICLCVIFITIAVILSMKNNSIQITIQTFWKQLLGGRVEYVMKPSCPNVLENMITGRWVQDKPNQTEMAAVAEFNRIIRLYHGMPQTLQREDNKCGNLDLIGTGKKKNMKITFRALCDPNGSTPCCFENRCVLKDVEHCRCPGCYDLRQKLHAEVCTWVPTNPTCKITMFASDEDACQVLKNMTIYFIGDSFLEQQYNAVLTILRRNKPYGPLKRGTAEDIVQRCHRHAAIAHACLPHIDTDAVECNNTTFLRKIINENSRRIHMTIQHIASLRGKLNSIVVLGIGIHDDYNLTVVENKILNPLLSNLAKSPWPKPIWLSANSPGLLKSPTYNRQQTEDVIRYNLRVNDILRKRGIPVLDYFEMTKSVMSFDGTHYGLGVNHMKAQIFLNYILEMRTDGIVI